MLVLDDAVSARYGSVQAQVVNLLQDLQVLQSELELARISISHKLTVVRFMADKAVVMKEGEAAEQRRALRSFSVRRSRRTPGDCSGPFNAGTAWPLDPSRGYRAAG